MENPSASNVRNFETPWRIHYNYNVKMDAFESQILPRNFHDYLAATPLDEYLRADPILA